MKYEIKTEEDGTVSLKLGLTHSVNIRDSEMESIIGGVEMLIQNVVGVSAFELCTAVMAEFEKADG